MSSDPAQEYFSDGMSEEILNLLAQIEPLKVIARTSSFSFKGKDVDIATMAEQMNVRHLLEGSVRRSGDKVRITAQLIDAKDSSHLWSESFDRDYSAGNLFSIQSEIARAIAGRLRMTLTGAFNARGGVQGRPVRLQTLAQSFGAYGSFASVCSSYGNALRGLATRIQSAF